jgi:hypothetical protein
MKKKIVSFLVVGIFVLSGLGAVAITRDIAYGAVIKEKSKIITIAISSPIIEKSDNEYFEVHLKEASSYLMNPGHPVLPKVVKAVELPFGVKNVKVEVTPKNVHEYEIEGEIRPAPPFVPLATARTDVVVKSEKDEEIYSIGELFPSSWYRHRVGCGLNNANEPVTHVAIQTYPARYIPASGKLFVADNIDIKISYENTGLNPFPATAEYDLVIIAPSSFSNDLQKLVNHKNNLDPPVNTKLMITTEIYDQYSGIDKPEKIKYFIKDAIENWGVTYVLLVGGLKSLIWGNPRDNANEGTKDWLVPVRYTNIYDNPKYPLDNNTFRDPGVISDLYYADIYKEGGEFEDWDPYPDGIICAWGKKGYVNDTGDDVDTEIDWYPDVCLGRLACRNKWEVRSVVDKIINYETKTYGKDWFNKMLVVSGDGFLDQEDLDIQWDTNDLLDGEYIIYAQSTNPDMESGPVDVIHVTLDQEKETSLTFNHDDHLKFDSYPYKPIAEITSPSDGDILGNTDYFYVPKEKEAYCNQFLHWADIEYIDGVMHIRGKSYDPQPYGVETDVHIWINNSAGEKVFEHTVENTKMYYEGEWVTGDRLLKGYAGALYYMPEFNEELLWTSNGEFTGQSDVINAFSKGSGFTFLSGHGSPTVWGNHLAGVPGNRRNSHVDGLSVIDFFGPPFFPMERLSNKYKTPVVIVGGCHNSQFNVSFLATIIGLPDMWCFGAPECWSWWLTRLSKRGAIACIGNTGLGYGVLGDDCTSVGLDGGICIEFFKQYSEDHQILGDAYRQTLTNYVTTFDISLQEHGKTLSQWVLHGDPSLKIGGYETSESEVKIIVDSNGYNTDGIPKHPIGFQAQLNGRGTPTSYKWSFDKDGNYDNGEYDTYATGEDVTETWTKPGIYWVQLEASYDEGYTEISHTIVDIRGNEEDQFPDEPTKPSGQISVKLGVPYIYSTKTTDPYDIDLYYLFDWGDGKYSIVGPKESGTTVSAAHIWSEKGDYEVKVMVVNTMSFWSDWSDPLTVTVPRNRAINPLFLNFLQNHPHIFPILQKILSYIL